MTVKKHILALALLSGAMLAGCAMLTSGAALAAETPNPPRVKWSYAGPFGTFDRGQLQRGFKVHQEVCKACHGLALLSFRNLAEPGGPEFSRAQATTVAAEYEVTDGPNDKGEMFKRPGRLADRFPPPFPNEQAGAFANNGKAPPDLSVMAKARGYERGFPWFVLDIFTTYQELGPDYLVALLTGYEDPPQGTNLPAGTYYNKYFPGHTIAMPKPLQDGQVTYTDGAPQTTAQYARDVSAFLMWAAEPHLEARKRVGLQVMIFLLVFAGLMYFTKKKVWHEVEKPREIAHGQDPRQTSM